MDNCCFPPGQSQSWYDLAHAMPIDPLSVIANAYINKSGVIAGKFENAPDFLASTWQASSPLSVTAAPTCVALGTDNLQNVADATQWGFNHLTANLGSTITPPLRKLFFVRGGEQFEMDFNITSGGTTITDILLSFLDNAGTRGDDQATVPCIGWRAYSNSGAFTLGITFKDGVGGRLNLGLWTKDNSGNIAMLEMNIVVVGPNMTESQQIDTGSKLQLGDLVVSSFQTGGGQPPMPSPTLNTYCWATCVKKDTCAFVATCKDWCVNPPNTTPQQCPSITTCTGQTILGLCPTRIECPSTTPLCFTQDLYCATDQGCNNNATGVVFCGNAATGIACG